MAYDKNCNINAITENGKVIKYYYNELNELVREDNQRENKTIVYTYDLEENILKKTEYPYTTGTPSNPTRTYSYSYGDANWRDKLTSFDGKAITYDAIGNPLAYDGYTYTWEEGRQLKSINKADLSMEFKYNADGIRTEKKVNGVTTSYRLVGDKVTYETNGTDKIYYSYDSTGNLVSMNLNGTEYYYIRNAQGDIIGLLDGTGAQVVSYTYDSWGKLISTTGSLAATVGVKNPYRYRGYRYDSETGFAYVGSRYYDPNTGRWINTDSQLNPDTGLVGMNMFAYCNNNSVNMTDDSGHCPFWNGVKDFFVGQWNTVKAVVSDPVGSYVSYASNPWNWFPVARTVRDEVTALTGVWGDIIAGDVNSLAYKVGGRAGLGIEMAVTAGVAKGISVAKSSIVDIGIIKGVRANPGYPGIRYRNGGVVKSIEIHTPHNGHGFHFQKNTWWYNFKGYQGQPFRAFGEPPRLTIFPWKDFN